MDDYSSTFNIATKYDVIIIGGGNAGLVVASRLSEKPDFNILVLEAGLNHVNDPMAMTPGAATGLLGNEKYDWNFKITPQVSKTHELYLPLCLSIVRFN
jgi:choline dehydrogenase-like flavoprotein